MTSSFPFTPAIWSYALAGVIFVAFAALMIFKWRGGHRAVVLLCAVGASSLWAGSMWAAFFFQMERMWVLSCFLDAARISGWLVFLTLLLEGSQQEPTNDRTSVRLLKYLAIPSVLLVASALIVPIPPWHDLSPADESIAAYYVGLGAAVFGLALTEQLYGRTPNNRRWAIKPLIIGLSGMFAFDLLTFSGAALFHHVDPAMLSARGIASALVIFFVGVATARNTSWTVDVYVSRQVVYQSTVLLIVGIYLIIVASAAYWVQYFGGDWGGTLRVALVFALLLGLAALVFSGSLRARIRVAISKNLFSYRYEYRKEWLRFTRVLGTNEQGEDLYQQVVRALADLVESTGGAIWLKNGDAFVEVANLNMRRTPDTEPITSPFCTFLARTDWVVCVDEAVELPDKYQGLTLPEWLLSLDNVWLVVPLPNGTDLIGFVVLSVPRAPIDVNWEVRDLLKTASRQAASYIAQVRAKEALVEAGQFDAFNRMSAFVVHDLKNLVAQLALVVTNAERHRNNPDFQKDMLETVQHAVGRMNQLMLQLRTGTTPMEKPRPVDVCAVIQRIIQAKAALGSVVDLDLEPNLRTLAHEDRIERVFGHFVQNAVEAIEIPGGRVSIRAVTVGTQAMIEIADNGVGMAEDFIREKLFHPFQTTKAQGMGIGMYESSQYVRGIGGRITVTSSPNSGTRFDVFLPLANVPLSNVADYDTA